MSDNVLPRRSAGGNIGFRVRSYVIFEALEAVRRASDGVTQLPTGFHETHHDVLVRLCAYARHGTIWGGSTVSSLAK